MVRGYWVLTTIATLDHRLLDGEAYTSSQVENLTFI